MLSVTEDLATIPTNPGETCELVHSFLESWHVMAVDAVIQSAEEEVVMAERRLGLTLPVALRWMLTHVGIDNRIIGSQDPFVQPQLLEIDEQGVLAYRMEQQNCAEWGIPVAEIGQSDPPVVWKDLQGSGDSTWSPYQERLSVDLLEMTFNEAMLRPNANLMQMEVTSDVPSQLSELMPLAIPSHVFWAVPDGPPVKWYGIPDCIIRNDGDAWLWAFGRTADALDMAMETIPGDWENLAD